MRLGLFMLKAWIALLLQLKVLVLEIASAIPLRLPVPTDKLAVLVAERVPKAAEFQLAGEMKEFVTFNFK